MDWEIYCARGALKSNVKTTALLLRDLQEDDVDGDDCSAAAATFLLVSAQNEDDNANLCVITMTDEELESRDEEVDGYAPRTRK